MNDITITIIIPAWVSDVFAVLITVYLTLWGINTILKAIETRLKDDYNKSILATMDKHFGTKLGGQDDGKSG